MQYTYFNKETGKVEDVSLQRWCWEVYYNDGTFLKQYDDAGHFHRIAEIDESKLAVAKMVNQETKQALTVLWKDGYKFIHLYKHFLFNAGLPTQYRSMVYVFGYEKRGLAKKTKTLFVITQLDEIIVTDDLNKIEFT